MNAARIVLAAVGTYAGAEIAMPHLPQDWRMIVGAMLGGFLAQVISRSDLRKVAQEAAERAVKNHEVACDQRYVKIGD